MRSLHETTHSNQSDPDLFGLFCDFLPWIETHIFYYINMGSTCTVLNCLCVCVFFYSIYINFWRIMKLLNRNWSWVLFLSTTKCVCIFPFLTITVSKWKPLKIFLKNSWFTSNFEKLPKSVEFNCLILNTNIVKIGDENFVFWHSNLGYFFYNRLLYRKVANNFSFSDLHNWKLDNLIPHFFLIFKTFNDIKSF